VDEDIEKVPDEDCASFGGSGGGEGDEGYGVRGDEQDDCEAEGEDGDGVREEGGDRDEGLFYDGHGAVNRVAGCNWGLRCVRGESCLTRGSKGP